MQRPEYTSIRTGKKYNITGKKYIGTGKENENESESAAGENIEGASLRSLGSDRDKFQVFLYFCRNTALPIIKKIWTRLHAFVLFLYVILLAMMYLLAIYVRACFTNVGKLSVLRFSNPRLFTRHKKNKYLVFEEPKSSLFEHNKNGALEKLGKLAPDQIKYVKRVHIIQESERMAYLARHASGCHYEMYFIDIVSTLEITAVNYKIYWKEKNYSKDFIVLVADRNDIDVIIQRFNFDYVDKNIVSPTC